MDKNCTITNNYYYNCCGGETAGNGNGNPVGTVISYMGTKVPRHYLACDGAVLNITDYPALSEQIKDEFGTVDYFGGDGTVTFAVPDLRNEFLRGHHGDAEEQLSGDIGKHQKATQHVAANKFDTYLQFGGDHNIVENFDSVIAGSNWSIFNQTRSGVEENVLRGFTSRPTNMAVLYCIKYE